MYEVWKARLAIVLMSLSFFLMIELKRINCLGDYVLEYLNINSWSGENTGTHLTVMYFGVVFILSIPLVKRYAIDKMKLNKRTILLSFIALVTGFVLSTQFMVDVIKANSRGLLAIGYHTDNSILEYSYKGGELTDFVAVFTLENYSNDEKKFYVSMDSPWYREDGFDELRILDSEDNNAEFKLHPKEKRTFVLSMKDYNVKGGMDFTDGGTSGLISELVLSNKNGDNICLSDDNFFGIIVNK